MRASVSPTEGMFSLGWRVGGTVWAVWSVAVAVVVSGSVEGRTGYLVVFVVLASGAFTTPALVAGWVVVRLAPRPDRPAGVLWFGALVLIYASGLAMLVGLATGADAGKPFALPFVLVVAGMIMAGNVWLVRGGSGQRAVAIDAIDCLACITGVVVPAALLWGDDVVSSDEAWFATPAALAAVGMVAGLFWMVLLVARRRGDEGPSLASYLIAFTVLGAVDGAAQAAQAVAGFTLPAPPLVAVHATCMAFALLIPLNMPRRPSVGLRDVAPQAQARGGALAALLPLAGVPGITLVGFGLDGAPAGAGAVAVGALSFLVVLIALRQVLAQRETRRLYVEVEQASAKRSALLAELLRSAEDERHRAASSFHAHAARAYARFVSFVQVAAARPSLAGVAVTSRGVQEDLAQHVDALRQLVTVTAPGVAGAPGRSLAAMAHAYLDGLHGGGRSPRLRVAVAEELHLTWEVETALVLILQGALRDVRRRGGATFVDVTVEAHDATIVLRASDDGRATGDTPVERLEALSLDGLAGFPGIGVVLDSAEARGTTVTARLTPGATRTSPGWQPRPSLRAVPDVVS